MADANTRARHQLSRPGTWTPTLDDPPDRAGLNVWRELAEEAGVPFDEFLAELEPDPSTKNQYRLRQGDDEDAQPDRREQIQRAVQAAAAAPAPSGDVRKRRPPEPDEDGYQEEQAPPPPRRRAAAPLPAPSQIVEADDELEVDEDADPLEAHAAALVQAAAKRSQQLTTPPFTDTELLDFVLGAYGLTRGRIAAAKRKADAQVKAIARSALDTI